MTKRIGQIICFLLIGLLLLSGGVLAQANVYDFDGQTVSFYTFFNDVTPLGARGEYRWLDPDPRLQAHIDQIEDTFNVKLEFLTRRGSGVEDIITGTLAGETEGDVYTIQSRQLSQLAGEGFLYPLTDILDDEYFNSLPTMFRNHDYGWFDGELYMFEAQYLWPEVEVMYWNKDIFEELGFPDLYELYENGEWTWEVMKDLALQATMDTTGDGEIDQYGLSYYFNSPWDPNHSQYIYGLAATNNATVTERVDGREVFAFDQEEALETLSLLQELYEAGAMVAGGSSLVNEGKVAMMVNLVHIFQQFPTRNPGTQLHEYGLVPLPKGPKADAHITPVRFRWNFAIPIVTKHDPKALVELASAVFMTTNTYRDVQAWEDGFYDELALTMPDRTAWAIARESLNNVSSVNYLFAFDQVGGFAGVINEVITQGKSPSAGMAEIKPVIQQLIDEIYKQQ